MFDVRELNIAIELWGVAFCAIGIACALLLARDGSRYRNLLVSLFSLQLASSAGDAVAGVCRGQAGALAWAGTHAGNFVTFAAAFLLAAAFTSYLCARLGEAGATGLGAWRRAVWVAAAVMCALAAVGVFYRIDAGNLYHRSNLYWVSGAFGIVVQAVNAVLVWRHRRGLGTAALAVLLAYTVVPLLASVVQALVYGLNLITVVDTLGLVAVFLETQVHSARVLQRRTEELARAEAEAAEGRMRVMVSQIQPHFLFNALDTIYGLVDEDTGKAKGAIASFSRYLRANLDSLGRAAPVPVEAELEHVRTYLELERMADEDKIAYEIDAQAGGFLVPALSVQTIAENAVKHGVSKRPEGGSVVVRTRERADEHTVAVIDDGVGFDVGAEPEGVGISNTRARLAAMCGGTLEVRSEPGRGTSAVMRIPKDGGGAA